MKDKKELLKVLKDSGLKNTKHRLSLLEVLYEESQPVSAEKIYFKIKEKAVDINLSTVYRNLEMLVNKDIATKLTFLGDSKALYEYNRMEHRHYLVCVDCKKILAIEHCPLQDYEMSLEEELGFQINAHKLVMYGYCPKCKKNKGNDR